MLCTQTVWGKGTKRKKEIDKVDEAEKVVAMVSVSKLINDCW